MHAQDSGIAQELKAPASRTSAEFLSAQLAERMLSHTDATFIPNKPSPFLVNDCGDGNVPSFLIVSYGRNGEALPMKSNTRYDTSHRNCPKDERGKPQKYKMPFGCGVQPFNPTTTSHAEWVAAPEKYIAEGEFKTIAIHKLGKAVKGIRGIRGWHLKNSDELHPDLCDISPGQRVVIVPDGDWHTNPNVHRGAYMLMLAILKADGTPLLLDLPATGPGQEKVGIDDLIAQWRRDGKNVEAEFASLPRLTLENVPRPFEVSRDNPLGTARSFVEGVYPDSTLVRWDEAFYRWEGAGWSRISEESIRAQIYRFIDDNKQKPNQSFVTLVFDALKAATQLLVRGAPAWQTGDGPCLTKDVFACANGLMNLQTRELYPHTPDFFNLNWSEVAYLPSATCPTWDRFLSEVYPDDHEAIQLLQEWMGYCLTDDTSQQKMLMMVGAKRSGKGTIARVAQGLIGREGFCSPTLAGLGERFGLAALIGKKLAVVSDARISGKHDNQATLENMLRITGEDDVTCDRKNIAHWSGKFPTRFWVITNLVPGLMDSGGAFASRFLLLNHRKSFFTKEDSGLTSKLLAELTGIFNWALDGLERLRGRGYFVQPESGKETLHDLERLNSPIKAFVEDECELGAGYAETKDEVYKRYFGWVTRTGASKTPETPEKFTQSLKAATDEAVQPSKRSVTGTNKKEPTYRGIRLKPSTEPEPKFR